MGGKAVRAHATAGYDVKCWVTKAMFFSVASMHCCGPECEVSNTNQPLYLIADKPFTAAAHFTRPDWSSSRSSFFK